MAVRAFSGKGYGLLIATSFCSKTLLGYEGYKTFQRQNMHRKCGWKPVI
jgi:hypothetical protein